MRILVLHAWLKGNLGDVLQLSVLLSALRDLQPARLVGRVERRQAEGARAVEMTGELSRRTQGDGRLIKLLGTAGAGGPLLGLDRPPVPPLRQLLGRALDKRSPQRSTGPAARSATTGRGFVAHTL